MKMNYLLYKEYKHEEKWGFMLKYLMRREPLNRQVLRNLRMASLYKNPFLRYISGRRWTRMSEKFGIEISPNTKIGKGLYFGHPFGITINPATVLGEHVCIHKGVTIGVENRGKHKGTPTIGNCVWIGVNSTIFGNIRIGDDVLISPNSVVNFDVPSHSVVFGNPAMIKRRMFAVEGYISKETYLKYFPFEQPGM